MQFGFIGRKQYLEMFNRLWKSEQAEFLILYGRRRVGKTALLTEWIRRSSARALYWVAAPTSAAAQLRSFSQAVYNFSNSDAPAPASFTYATWEQAFQQLASLAQRERLALFIDEFTFLLEVTPGIAGQMQNLWDHLLSQTNIFLCLSGSHLGMMQRTFLSYQAPLYGRATARLLLQPFYFGSTPLFFPKYSPADRVAIYAMFGGIPAYWERIDPQRSISENIKTNLLTPNNLLQAEPRLLLQDFISEPHNYIAILSAIANGAHAAKEIASVSGLASGHVSKYLSVLTDTGFVERRIPVTANEKVRSGRYHITDSYLRFYYRFLADRQEQFALGIQEQALAEISKHMVNFIGTYTWEELCREWTLRAGAAGILPFLPDKVGSIWNGSAQVDVAGLNSMEKTLILGECKWTRSASGRKIMTSLVEEKASQVIPKKGDWKVFFVGFSRAGWTSSALEYQDESNQQLPAGTNWKTAGMLLIDLKRFDQDMKNWTVQ
ncbi:ATP-binding protein [bacterium]|nr:ATP-binding protein [bacterium]